MLARAGVGLRGRMAFELSKKRAQRVAAPRDVSVKGAHGSLCERSHTNPKVIVRQGGRRVCDGGHRVV